MIPDEQIHENHLRDVLHAAQNEFAKLRAELDSYKGRLHRAEQEINEAIDARDAMRDPVIEQLRAELAAARELINATYATLTPDGCDLPPCGINSIPNAIRALRDKLATAKEELDHAWRQNDRYTAFGIRLAEAVNITLASEKLTPEKIEEKVLAELAAANKRADDNMDLLNACVEGAEQKLKAAREDTERLDALDRNAVIRDRTLAIMERGADHEPIRWAGIEWDGKDERVRAAIDAARGKGSK